MIVWKFPLKVEKNALSVSGLGPFELEIPSGALVLTVGMQTEPVLWVLVDPTQPQVTHRFLIVGTGHGEVPDRFMYVGTFQMGWFVGHVFQELVV